MKLLYYSDDISFYFSYFEVKFAGCSLCLTSLWTFHLMDIACTTCRQGDVSATITLYSVTSIRATKLYDSFLQSLFVCTSQCVHETTCYYMTVNDRDHLCTYYSHGSVNLNVTQLATYIITTKSVTVSLNYCLSNLTMSVSTQS